MRKEFEITEKIPLHGPYGHLTKEGWSRHPNWIYDRTKIHASKLKIKEWDYYSVLSHEENFGITFTMSDLGYAGLFAICFLDFEKKFFHQVDTISLLPLGKIGFSAEVNSGSVKYSDKKLFIEYESQKNLTNIRFHSPYIKNFEGKMGLKGEIHLEIPESIESMSIATSWKENRKAFYYNTKINCMKATGEFQLGDRNYQFNKEKDFGALDWGRGVWTYKNRWYWSSASGLLNGKPFGFNLGYGFTDRSPASENIVLYENKIHKLDLIEFQIDESDYLKPWKFASNNGRLELDFYPIVDRNSSLNLFVIKSIQHQVFGKFSGKIILDDGRELIIKDFLGFAEDVLNHY
jgi:hypothetical protein